VRRGRMREAARMCPWGTWEPGSVAFCEERLCAWVVEPSNAWSSLAYVLAGLWLWRRSPSALVRQVALAGMLIGVGSFAFHATGTFVGELIDLTGMLMLSGLMVAQAWGRLTRARAVAVGAVWAALTVGALGVVLVVKPAGIPLFAGELLAAIALEVVLWARGQTPQVRRFAQALGCTGVALGVWALDFSHVVCSPTNHLLTGHAVWHLLNSVSIGLLGAFYGQAAGGASGHSPGRAVLGPAT
jgi:hypothetical protein